MHRLFLAGSRALLYQPVDPAGSAG